MLWRKFLKMFDWLKYLGVVLIGSWLGGCFLSIGEKIPTNSCCLIAKPILWSNTDTKETIKQVDAHNRVFEGLCVKNR